MTGPLCCCAQVLAYEANIEAAVLAQDAGTTPLPEDYTQFIPKVYASMMLRPWRLLLSISPGPMMSV